MKSSWIKLPLAALLMLVLMISCHRTSSPEQPPDAAFMDWITAYTGGMISSAASIEIHFARDADPSRAGDPAALFRFRPAISGEAFWKDGDILVFRPEKPLESGKKYDVVFKLGQLFDVPPDLREFPFSFGVIRQSFVVGVDGVFSEYDDFSYMALKGVVKLADVAEPDRIEKVLTARLKGQSLWIRWEHDLAAKISVFRIDSLLRTGEDQEVVIIWKGKPLQTEDEGETSVLIPSKDSFRVMEAHVVQHPEQYISILFSDPLSGSQSLSGLVIVEGVEDLKFTARRNELQVHPPARLQGRQVLRIDGTVRSLFEKALKDPHEIVLSFDALYPAVKFVNTGNILPQSGNLVIPFQAVNLNAVDVRIIRIYAVNIPQFLQSNEIGGQYELNRVGRPILQKRVDLVSNHFIDYGEWNTFFLSLDEMIRVEPEAIYNIKISFSREYSLYPCSDIPESPEEEEEEDYWYYDEDNSGLDWDSPGYFYESYYPRGFRWNERDNPCHISYYYQERFISRNILASNLGLIAKAGSDGAYTVAVTNLLNAEPLRGARVEFYSFQHQLLTSGTTGNLGTVVLEPEGKPFLLIASSGEQKGYLRLDDGSSLSLSKFPVEGEAIQEGLKGFIYGDRGVWRPGDTLFITFILEDGTRSLPPDHPVIFELLDPAARVIQKTVRTGGSDGFYSIITPTAEDAPTGNYIARISVGNSVFRKNLRVETIKPNRLKIGLDFGTDILVSSRESIWGTLQTRWLHGGRAGNLKANVSLIFRQKTAAFPDYKGFLFEDNSKRHFPEEEVIFDGRLDNEGKASVEIKPGTHREVPGMLSAALMVKVFEPSGEFSTDLVTLPFAPYPRFVGLSLEGTDRWGFLRSDSSYTCRLALVDPRGKPAGSGPVEITVYRMEWRWWWNSQDNDLAGYFSGSYQKPVITQMVNISNGKGQFNLNTEAMDWGRYFIRVTDPAGGHSAGTVFYVRRRWWWDEDAQDQGREFATMLELKTDKEKYRTGENATVTFPAGSTGQAWVTLENGSRVLAAEWVNIHDSRMEYSFEVTPEMTPNVYVYVTLLQPHAQTQNDAPVRLYGVIPVMAEDPASILVPVIKAPAEIRPEETYTLRIREDQGRAMTYTLAVVDEGLLDLTHFRTPDPWDYFYTKEALGVKTWDMFDQVIGAYGGKLERVLAVGGDGSESPPDKTKISRFKPVIRFMGPFRLRPGEEKKHELRMPNYVGSIRVMVIAGNGDQAYGHAEKTIPVKKPLMVLATLPRVLGPGETVTLPVSVFMMEDRQTDVIVKVETNERFVISGDPEKKVRFDRPGEQLLEFDLQVKPVTGAGFVTVTAAMGKEKASYRFDISIRNPNPPVKTGYFTRISAGETWDQPFALPGIKGTNSLQLETTGGLPLNISRHLAYLLDYPYGCAEQITSTAFAQLYLPDLCDLNQEQQERVRTNINLTTQKLIGLQNVDGGFVFWPGNRTSGDFLSSYIGHFMLEAESRGYPVSRGMKRSWISYQKSVSSRWNPDKDPDMPQAYRLFTLALAGESQMAAMNRMREMSRLTRDALSCLASAYAVSGQKEAARELLGLTGSAAEDDQLYRYTYGSMLRNDAMVLLALILADEEEGAERLAFRIAEEFGKEYYYSTQTTAFTLFALSRFTQGKRTDQPLRFTCQLGKQPKQSITTQYHIHWLKWDQLDERDDRIQVRNEGQEELYVRLTVSGTPARDTLPPAGKNLRITTQYTDLEGNMIDPGLLPQGMDFKAQITVSLPAETQRQDHLALSSVFPSGWEIIRRSRSGFEAEYTGGDFDYQDIRDDRVNTFFSLNPGDIKTFVVYLNATYRGRYWLPAVSCEAMYNHDVYARTSGQWVEVAGSE